MKRGYPLVAAGAIAIAGLSAAVRSQTANPGATAPDTISLDAIVTGKTDAKDAKKGY